MRPARSRRLGLLVVALVLLLVPAMIVLVAACQPSTRGDSPSTPTNLPPSDAPASTVTLAPSPPASGVVVDESLLSHVPSSVAGTPIEPDPETAGEVASDPALGESASAIAMGIFVGPGDSNGDDLAIVSVVQLRPGVFDEAFFADWRGEYDAAACEAAGGTGTSVSRDIGDVKVFVSSCVEDADIYHAHLDGDVLVSVTSVGSGGFGELVAAGLQP